MTKYLTAALIALAGLSAALFYRSEAQVATLQYNAATARADTATKALASAEAAIKLHRATTLALQKKAKVQDAALQDALAQNAAWAAQPVPAGVLDALRVR